MTHTTPPTPSAGKATGADAERAEIVAWLRNREEGWRMALRMQDEGVGMVHLPRLLADAIERGDHKAHAP